MRHILEDFGPDLFGVEEARALPMVEALVAILAARRAHILGAKFAQSPG